MMQDERPDFEGRASRDTRIVAALERGEKPGIVAARHKLDAGQVRDIYVAITGRHYHRPAAVAVPAPAPQRPAPAPDPPVQLVTKDYEPDGLVGQWWADPPDLDTEPDQPAALMETEQGRCLLPDGRFSVVYGGYESGKTWLALMAGALTAAQWRPVAYIDAEMSATAVYSRLRLLGGYGGPDDGPCGDTDRFRYVAGDQLSPGAPWELAQQAIIDWAAPQGLVILDTIGSLGGHTNNADEATHWHRQHVRPFLAAGLTVLGLDHDIRSKSGQRDRSQHGSIGSAAKANLADFILQTTPATWTTKLDGSLSIIKRKDRHSVQPDVPRNAWRVAGGNLPLPLS